MKNDEYFGRQEVYHHELIATVPVARPAGGTLEVPLEVTYQGCADAGLVLSAGDQDRHREALRAAAARPAPVAGPALGRRLRGRRR